VSNQVVYLGILTPVCIQEPSSPKQQALEHTVVKYVFFTNKETVCVFIKTLLVPQILPKDPIKNLGETIFICI
jgi:hypothetical protein